MPPTIPKRLLVKRAVRAALEGIGGGDNWNNAGVVVTPHPELEGKIGDVESPIFSYQDDDQIVDENKRTFGQDWGVMVLSIRGAQKSKLLDSFELEEKAEKMLQDIIRCIMAAQIGSGVVTRVSLMSPTRTHALSGIEGWVTCVATFEITFAQPFSAP